ncbi:PREDICTED: uncharacterized protein LOC109158093 [Ipomoea nil]|uniref:uncharacterized protein LOC109158093 n=1 Tax=Ipomoea nil TaxID=35883 RepID=UPI0009016BCE|nr:PREDICTED: uncharacterized protein LOC109158093 [Ipomoea nil]
MGLFSYTVAGGGFIMIGAWEAFASSKETLKVTPPPPSPLEQPQLADITTPKSTRISSSATFLAGSVLSFLFIVNSLISISDAISSEDDVGVVIQLEVISISLLFILYSVVGFFSRSKDSLQLPCQIPNLISLFAFGEEFLIFYIQRKDPSGVENRYYDLFLVPIAACAFCTILELKNPQRNYCRLGRGIGLVLQGMWILQMGFSFFSGLMAHGCALHERSRGNYTVKCKGQHEYHRGRAIATLQFNCHLVLLVTIVSVVFCIVCKKNGIRQESSKYRPIGAEVQQMEMGACSAFSLESDDDEGANHHNALGMPGVAANGFHAHQ